MKIITWALSAFISYTLLWFGLFEGVDGAYNIYLALASIICLISFAVYTDVFVKDADAMARKFHADRIGVHVRATLSAIMNLSIIVLLIWFGKWGGAIIVGVATFNMRTAVKLVWEKLATMTEEELRTPAPKANS